VTDHELVAKKLALIETCVRELRSLARPDAIRARCPGNHNIL
jgi:hypothetical protein